MKKIPDEKDLLKNFLQNAFFENHFSTRHAWSGLGTGATQKFLGKIPENFQPNPILLAQASSARLQRAAKSTCIHETPLGVQGTC